jgi:hypothetical protein
VVGKTSGTALAALKGDVRLDYPDAGGEPGVFGKRQRAAGAIRHDGRAFDENRIELRQIG